MERVFLVGAEEVTSAGIRMEHAAMTMKQAANSIESSLFIHRQFLDQFIERFERAFNALSASAESEDKGGAG